MATLMLYQGEQLKLVAARLGHANEMMVLRKYGHLLPERTGTRRSGSEGFWDALHTDGTRGR